MSGKPGILVLIVLLVLGSACGEGGIFRRDAGDGNREPVANAGPDRIVLVGQEVLMSGKSSTDPDGDPITRYRWAFQEKPPLSAAFLLDWDLSETYFVPDQPGEYYVGLTVSDGRDEGTDLTVVRARSFNPQNLPPVFDALAPGDEIVAVFPGGEVVFEARASDPDGDEVVTNWYRDGVFVASGERYLFTATTGDVGTAVAVRVEVSDGDKSAEHGWVVVVNQPGTGANRPPEIDPIPDRQVQEGEVVYLAVRATDPDGDPIRYFSSGLPDGASFSRSSGVFSWVPDYDQAGEYRLIFSASDGQRIVSVTVTITVRNTNRPPSLTVSGGSDVTEGGELVLLLAGQDPDADGLIYTIDPIPAGAGIYPVGSTAAFVWRPGYEQAGGYELAFTVTDLSDPPLSDTALHSVTVADTNRPPLLSLLDDRQVDEDELINFTIAAVDPDGDGVSLGAEALPAGASLTPAGMFSWRPDYHQAGFYLIVITATDDGEPPLTDTGEFTIVVNNTNRPPAITSLTATPGTIKSGQMVSFSVTAADPDGDELQYFWDFDGNGTWEKVSPEASATEPYQYERLGTYSARVRVSDAGGLFDEETVTVKVKPGTAERIYSRKMVEGRAMGVFIEQVPGIPSSGYVYVADGEAGMQIFRVPDLDAPELVLWSRIPAAGEARNVTVHANRAYLSLSAYYTSKNGVALIDVTDRGAPEFVDYLEGDQAIVDTFVSAHPVSGDEFAYLLKADDNVAMFIYDMADLSDVYRTAYSDPYNYKGKKVSVDEQGFVYAAADRGLGILDFRLPSEGTGGYDLEVFESDSRDVKVRSYPDVNTSCALLARGFKQGGILVGGQLISYDVNDPLINQPLAPPELCRLDTFDCLSSGCGGKNPAPEAMAVIGDPPVAYLAIADWGYQMVDVSVPWNLQIVATQHSKDIYDPCGGYIDCDDHAYGIAAHGDYTYLADGTWGMMVVKNDFWGGYPARATTSLVASYHTSGDPGDLKVVGDRLFLALGRGGMDVYDLTEPGSPALVGNMDTPGEAKGVWANDLSWAYVSDRDSSAGTYPAVDEDGLRVIDLATQPTRPAISGSAVPSGLSSAGRVFVDGARNLAYLCADKLYLIDVTDKNNPSPLGSFAAGDPRDVAASGSYAYVVYGDSLKVINVSDPAVPSEVASAALVNGRSIARAGNLLYVADASSGLKIFDVSVPGVITARGTYAATATDVEVSGEYAFVAADAGGVLVLDVSNPAAPALLAQKSLSPKVANRISVRYDDGARAYYAYTLNGVWDSFHTEVELNELAVVEVK